MNPSSIPGHLQLPLPRALRRGRHPVGMDPPASDGSDPDVEHTRTADGSRAIRLGFQATAGSGDWEGVGIVRGCCFPSRDPDLGKPARPWIRRRGLAHHRVRRGAARWAPAPLGSVRPLPAERRLPGTRPLLHSPMAARGDLERAGRGPGLDLCSPGLAPSAPEEDRPRQRGALDPRHLPDLFPRRSQPLACGTAHRAVRAGANRAERRRRPAKDPPSRRTTGGVRPGVVRPRKGTAQLRSRP